MPQKRWEVAEGNHYAHVVDGAVRERANSFVRGAFALKQPDIASGRRVRRLVIRHFGRHRRSVGQMNWKVVGLAGVIGLVATGLVATQLRREWTDLSSEELRQALHDRLASPDQ